jgi:hypothetical protein
MSTENQTNTPGALAGPTPIPTLLNVTALAKRFGVARTTIRRRLKQSRAGCGTGRSTQCSTCCRT